MAIWYVDPVGGTDVNASVGNGDSFATRRKRITNIVAPVAAGDTVRIMSSPAPTSLGVTGEWTTGPYATAQAPTSSTNATPIVFTKIGHGLATGDTIIIVGHTVNTKANGVWEVIVTGNTFALVNADSTNSVGNGVGGATGTFRQINSCHVMIATPLTKAVALTGNSGIKVNWTAGTANVVPTLNTTDFKEGFGSLSLAINATFTTGLAAYWPLGAITSFATYQQISFWIKQTAGTIGLAGSIQIKLCSDVAGVTAVNTFNIPALGALNAWVPITVDLAVNLGASIRSVAFYVVTDNAAQTFLIDHIIACKASSSADSLSLQSLLTKNTAGEASFAIQSINDTRVMLDQETNTVPASSPARGYFGTTETVTTYKRETHKTAIGTTLSALTQAITLSGTAALPITYSGGWDSTAMTTQSGESWFDGLNGLNYGLSLGSTSYNIVTNLALVRYNYGIYLLSATNCSISAIALGHCSGTNLYATATSCQFTVPYSYNSGGVGLNLLTSAATIGTFGNVYGNSTTGINGSSSNALYVTCGEVNGSGTNGVDLTNASDANLYIPLIKNSVGGTGILFTGSDTCTLYDAVISGSFTASVRAPNSGGTTGTLVRCTLSDATPVTARTAEYSNQGGLFSQGQDGNALNHQQYKNNGTTSSDVTVRHTAAGISWKLSPTSSTFVTSTYPYYMPVAKVACAAGTLVTASVWMYRTNTGLTARLMCKGRQILGVNSDVSTLMTAAINTWEAVIITFTPTEVGVVELLAECWGGTTYSLYVDDFSVSQV